MSSSTGLGDQLQQLKRSRCASDRVNKLQQLKGLQEEEKELDQIINNNKENDPEEIKALQLKVEQNKTAVNRWTDNTWVCKKFLTKAKGMAGKEVNHFTFIDS